MSSLILRTTPDHEFSFIYLVKIHFFQGDLIVYHNIEHSIELHSWILDGCSMLDPGTQNCNILKLKI